MDVSINDVVTVGDPNDSRAAWNNEFRGTVRNVRGGYHAVITVEAESGEHIDVHPTDILKKH